MPFPKRMHRPYDDGKLVKNIVSILATRREIFMGTSKMELKMLNQVAKSDESAVKNNFYWVSYCASKYLLIY